MEKEINIKKILGVIIRRWWVVALVTVVLTVLAGYYSYNYITPLYQTSARLMISADSAAMGTLTALVKEPIVLQHVVDELELDRSPEALGSQLTLTSVSSSQLAVLNIVDTDPFRAQSIANTSVDIFKREIPSILSTPVDITLLTPAKLNPWPFNVDHTGMMMKGMIAGIILGIGLVFLLDSLDDTVRNSRDIEKMMGVPVLGHVSKFPKQKKPNKILKKVLRKMSVRGETFGS